MKALFSPRSSASTQTAATNRKAADLTGWLHKRGETNTAFKSRFFVLAGKNLAYFENNNAQDKAKGEVTLDGSTCEAVEPATKGRFRFQLNIMDKGSQGRTYVMEASDQETREMWVTALMRAAVRDERPVHLPEGIMLEQVVGTCPTSRTWRTEWVAMRIEQLRLVGATHMASRKECSQGGSESIEKWATVRAASIEWKKSQGWDPEHAIAYTLITTNRGALARSVRERSGQYGASLHLISFSLGLRVKPHEPAPPVYYHLLGQNGLATTDPSWAVLLQPDVAPGLKFVTTANAVARNDPQCFPLSDTTHKACKGVHEKYIVGGGTNTQYHYGLITSPVVKVESAPSTAGDRATMTPPSHHTMVLVDGEGSRWELPPLATVTLVSVAAPGTWGAFNAERVDRTLYTVSVAWTASAVPEQTMPVNGEKGEAAADASPDDTASSMTALDIN